MVEVKVSASVDEAVKLGEPDMYGIQRFGQYADPRKLVSVLKGGDKPEALNSMTLQVRPLAPAPPPRKRPGVRPQLRLCQRVLGRQQPCRVGTRTQSYGTRRHHHWRPPSTSILSTPAYPIPPTAPTPPPRHSGRPPHSCPTAPAGTT